MKIWIVDDNKNLLEIIYEALCMDHDVTLLDSGGALLSQIDTTHGEDPEVLLVDWNLPGTATALLLDKMVTKFPRCHTVIMSGDLTSSHLWPSSADRLEKPFKLAELKTFLHSLTRAPHYANNEQ